MIKNKETKGELKRIRGKGIPIFTQESKKNYLFLYC